MDLYDLYDKYCLEVCSERQTYKPYYEGQTGICPNCHLDGFIGFVNTTRHIDLSFLTEENEQTVLKVMSEIMEAQNVEPEEAFKIIISYGLQAHWQMKNFNSIIKHSDKIRD